MKRSSVVWGGGLLVIPALLGYCHVRTTQMNAAFEGVVVGDTETTVVAKMGRPHRVLEGCGYYHGRPIAGCREYVYFPPWTVADEAWAIRFDANGTVTSTSHFVSP